MAEWIDVRYTDTWGFIHEIFLSQTLSNKTPKVLIDALFTTFSTLFND